MPSYWLLRTLRICNGETTATCRCREGRMIHIPFAIIVIALDAVDRIQACAVYEYKPKLVLVHSDVRRENRCHWRCPIVSNLSKSFHGSDTI